MGDTTDVSIMLEEAMKAAKATNFSGNGTRGKNPRTAIIEPTVIEREYNTDEVPLDERCFQCDILFGLWRSARWEVLRERRNGNKALVLSEEETEHAKRLVIKKLANPPTPREPGKVWPESLDHWGTCPDLGED